MSEYNPETRALIAALEAENKRLEEKIEQDKAFWKYVLDKMQKMTDEAGLNINPAECSWEDYVSYPLELLGDKETENARLRKLRERARPFVTGYK